jgi:hypothetical protein
MKVYLIAKNDDGVKCLKNIVTLKEKVSWAQRMILRRQDFNAEIVKEDPYTIQIKQKMINNLPNDPLYRNSIDNAMLAVIKEHDGNPADVEVQYE